MQSQAKLPIHSEGDGILNIKEEQEKSLVGPEFKEEISQSPQESTLASLKNPNDMLDVVQIYLEQAQLYLIHNNLEKAIAACKEALQVSPETAEAYKIWGNVLQIKGLTTDAMGAYAKALLICPNFSEVYANLGSLYANQKDWHQASEYYQKAIESNPEFAGAYRNLARVQEKLNKPKKQTDCLISALKLNPKLGTAEDHYKLASILLNQGQIEESALFFRNAVKLKPDFVAAYDMLANLLEQQGNWKAAAVCYRKLLDIRTVNLRKDSSQELLRPKKQTQLLSSSKFKLLPADISEAQMAISTVSKAASVSTVETEESSVTEDSSVKIQSLLEIARNQKNSEVTQVKLGDLSAQKRNWEKSICFYRAALKINPKLTGVYQRLGKVYAKLGKRREAAECWYRAFTLEPKIATAKQHFYLGNALLELREIDKAVVCYRVAIKIQSNFKDAYIKLVNVFLSQGRNNDAESICQKFLDLYPENILIQKKLEEIRKKIAYPSAGILNISKGEFQGRGQSEQSQVDRSSHDKLTIDKSTLPSVAKPGNQNADRNSQKINLATEEHQRGEQYKNDEKWNEAINAFRKSIELNPSFSWSHHNLGQCYQSIGKWFQASLAFQDAIKLHPDFIWSYYSLGEVLEQLNYWDEAMEAYSEAVQIDEKSAKVHARIAYIHSLRGELDQALISYRLALELQPDLKWIEGCINSLIYNYGVNFLSIGSLEEAEKYFQKVQLVEVSQIPPKWFVDQHRNWPWYQFSSTSAFTQKKSENFSWPKISIVTPSLNQGEFIEETILSVLNQGYENLEYIVVDGDSTDQTLGILRKYQDAIDVILVESDTGQANAINKGFSLANGEIFSWLNSDDMLAPGALYRVALEYLSSQADVIAGICTVHRQYQIELIRKPNIKEDDFTVKRLIDVENSWKSGDCFFQPETFFSRNIWERAGAALDESLHYVMDHDMWIRFAKAGATLKILDWPVGLFRKHDAQKTANEKAMLDELKQVTEDPRWKNSLGHTSDYQLELSNLNNQLIDSREENEFLRFELEQVQKELEVYLDKNRKKDQIFNNLENLSQQAISVSQHDVSQP